MSVTRSYTVPDHRLGTTQLIEYRYEPTLRWRWLFWRYQLGRKICYTIPTHGIGWTRWEWIDG